MVVKIRADFHFGKLVIVQEGALAKNERAGGGSVGRQLVMGRKDPSRHVERYSIADARQTQVSHTAGGTTVRVICSVVPP